MSDGSHSVRSLQQHLRRAGALLAQQQFDAACAAVDDALALDPASLPAQALRERIDRARSAASHTEPEWSVPERPIRSGAAAAPMSDRFVPPGVDAQTWLGFEQRIQDRRFRALLETIDTALAAGDGVGARIAFEEARELRGDAPELMTVADRVTMLPAAMPTQASVTALRARVAGAVSLLVVGVTLVLGIEWLRPSGANMLPADSMGAPVESVDARETHVATSGTNVSTDIPQSAPINLTPEPAPAEQVKAVPVEDIVALPPAGPASLASVRPATAAEGIQRLPTPARPATTFNAATTPAGEAGTTFRGTPVPFGRDGATGLADPTATAPRIPPNGEIPDDYVAPRLAASAPLFGGAAGPAPSAPAAPAGTSAAGVAGSASAPVANVMRQPMSVTQPPAAAPAVAAAAVSPTRLDETRVARVLNEYARAYGRLDAGAVRAVWPSVDERALARAFAGLASQDVSFENCSIDVRGTTANASCRGRATYVGKIGSGEPRSEPRQWHLELRRNGEEWTIQSADAQRLTLSER